VSESQSTKYQVKYQVFNDTDGFPAAPYLFDTEEKAKEWISSWRKQLQEVQGYYLTSMHERISPNDVVMLIQEVQLEVTAEDILPIIRDNGTDASEAVEDMCLDELYGEDV
jgi:hypothetical protein